MNDERLRLENQLCFPLYACAKEIIKHYKPYLAELDLTYTQYITMLVLWEEEEINVKSLGEKLFLDSGTLTPVLKKLESKGYIFRKRSLDDERNLIVSITNSGKKIKKQASIIPLQIGQCINLDVDESLELYKLLYKILKGLEEIDIYE